MHSVIPIWFPGKLRTTQCASILQCQFSLTEKEKNAEGTFRLRNRTSDILKTAGLLMSKNCRSTEIPEEYGEGSKVLKACKPPSLVEYEQAKEGGDSKVAFLDNLEFQYVAPSGIIFIFPQRWRKQSNGLRKRDWRQVQALWRKKKWGIALF